MMLQISRESTEPLYLQISHQLKNLIMDGTLPAGYRLPPERKLAEQLDVNRTTILNAYRELKADDLVEAQVGYGTVVKRVIREEAHPIPETHVTPLWRHMYSKEAMLTDDSITRDILALANRPDIISFAAGIPAQDTNPLSELKDVMENLLQEKGHALYAHTPTEGLTELRESITQYVLERGIRAMVSETMVLSGSQQGISLLAQMLLDPGDTVLVEEPTFFCARQVFESRGAHVIGIPMDAEGIRTDLLEQYLVRYSPKFIYVVPTFQNPTGRVMSLMRRKALLALSYKYRVPIVEDDPYYGLNYDANCPPPIRALDPHGHVFYLGSFSKVLFMGLRVGWIHAPKAIIRQMAIMKQNTDLHTASISQWICDRFLRERRLQRHLATSLVANREKRDIMVAALAQKAHLIPGVIWEIPTGGLYIWMTLPDSFKMDRFLTTATKNGIAVVPGRVFTIDGTHNNCVRLNFTHPNARQIVEGVDRLVSAIRTHIVSTVVSENGFGAENEQIEAYVPIV